MVSKGRSEELVEDSWRTARESLDEHEHLSFLNLSLLSTAQRRKAGRSSLGVLSTAGRSKSLDKALSAKHDARRKGMVRARLLRWRRFEKI